jgi:L-lactate dehydrogenase complex protein LldG
VSDARAAILERIARALGDGRDTAAPAARTDNPPRHPRPELGDGTLLGVFVERLRASGASAVSTSESAAGAAVAAYLREAGVPLGDVPAASDPYLTRLQWPDELVLANRAPGPTEPAAVTGAYAAVAETGTLVLASGATHRTALNFLPDHHVVVLDCSRIVGHMEEVWELWRRERGPLPRALNFVTGPSRTADIEQTIQLGAHGPRRLHVVLVLAAEAPAHTA